MDDPFKKVIQAKNGVTYVFRYPSAMDMIRIDTKARELRGNVNDGIAVAFTVSQAVATLNTLCEEPKDTDFASLPFHVVDHLHAEVTKWVNSFLDDVGDGKEEASDSTGQ